MTVRPWHSVCIVPVMDPDEGTWFATVYHRVGGPQFTTGSKSDRESAVEAARLWLHLRGWVDAKIAVWDTMTRPQWE